MSFVKKLHSKVWREEKRKTLEKQEMSTSFKKGNVIYEVRIKSTPRGKLVRGIFALPVQVVRGLCTEQRSSWKGQSWRDKLLQRRICPVLTWNGETSSPSTLWMDAHSFPCYPYHLYCVQSLFDFIVFQTLIWIFPDNLGVCVEARFPMHMLLSACQTDCHASRGDRSLGILLY